MNVGFRLSLYLDSGAILNRLGFIWASCEAHLDVIGPPNGAPKRLGDKNGAGKLSGQKKVNSRSPVAPESSSSFSCFLDSAPKFSHFLGMCFPGAISF